MSYGDAWKGARPTVVYLNNTNAGTATASLTLKVGGATANLTFEITKAPGSVNPPTAKTLIYNGSMQDLITAGSSTTGQIQYTLNYGEWDTEIPQAINAGTYTVYYKVVGDANHSDVEGSVSVTVTQSGSTVTASTGENKTAYTYGEIMTIVISGITPTGSPYALRAPAPDQVAIWNGDTQLTEPQTVTGAPLTFTIPVLDVGTYNLTAKFTGNTNMAAAVAVVSVTVGKAPQNTFSITNIPNGNVAYGASFTLGTAGGSGDGTVTWAASENATVDANGTVSVTGVGAFTITATKAGGTNYLDAVDTYTGSSGKTNPVIGTVSTRAALCITAL